MTEHQLINALTTLVKGDVLQVESAERIIQDAITQHEERMSVYYHLATYLNEQKERRGIRRLRTA